VTLSVIGFLRKIPAFAEKLQLYEFVGFNTCIFDFRSCIFFVKYRTDFSGDQLQWIKNGESAIFSHAKGN
jgi:hypothetical protein